MLSRLHVKNFVLIDSLEIDFPEGLVIITGQTGAGKSILLVALSLLMGAKAESAMVSEGAENCVVEADFEVDPSNDYLKALLDENEVEWDEGHLVIRRVVNRSGRSRAFVNDSPVPVGVLQEISVSLVDIHSQHQTMLLSDKHFQLDMLDHFAGSLDLRGQCDALWTKVGKQKTELRQVEEKLARLSSEQDYNEAQFRQLESASIREGELAELEEEQKRLANAEEIKMSLDASLKEMDRLLSRAGKYIPSVSELSDRLDSCRRELDDIYSEVEAINSRIDMSPERLMQVEDRMSLLYSLMQKHGCRDEAELIKVREDLAEQLYDSTALEQKRDTLKAEVAATEKEYDGVASQLHESRKNASETFAESITAAIRGLELQYAIFEVDVNEVAPGPSGKDSVVFKFSSTGRNPVDLSKCASGGELSRIMLALKAMKARYTQMPTMIFDEIDTGVSGSVADKMGSMICEMGGYMQVFAITHLPQVAAKGTAHYMVSKDIDPSTAKAVSTIERLSGEQRVLEIARMLSGSVLTDAAIANAHSLLGL